MTVLEQALPEKVITSSKFNNFSEFHADLVKYEPISRKQRWHKFVRSFLMNKPIYQVMHFYFFDEIPLNKRHSLKIKENDCFAFDALLITNTDEIHLVKVILTQGEYQDSKEIESFLRTKISSDKKLIITDCTYIPKILSQNKNIYSIKKDIFDSITADELNLIISSQNRSFRKNVYLKPRNYQLKVIKAVEQNFENHNRSSVVMACGSGKTLVGLWICERHKDIKNIIVLLPSLSLIKQTLHIWLNNTKWEKVKFICVCSDKTVSSKKDELSYNFAELDFVVTTEPSRVRKFFQSSEENSGAINIVFSTYHSATVVASGMRKNDLFDIGIFDEAHKTAGVENKLFSFALLDSNLSIKKRLFLTATPRIIKKTKNGRHHNLNERYSMDNESLYGEKVYELKFSDAVKYNIITDYKIIFSVITNKEILDYFQKYTDIKGLSKILIKDIANMVAIENAISKYNISKVITFHSRVEDAKNFCKISLSDDLKILNNFKIIHVNGTMSSFDRHEKIELFKQEKKSILTNARCLTEGIDVPSVDMVVFTSPKKSKIDIVQALGRALRTSPGKQVGYILLPVYIDIDSDLPYEDALDSSEYNETWHVIRALTEYDGQLNDEICLRQSQRHIAGDAIYKGKKISILSNNNFDLNSLTKAVETKLFDNVNDSWNYYFNKLIKFKKENGHCNITKYNSEKDLFYWTVRMRKYFRQNLLTKNKLILLTDLGFIFDLLEINWLESYNKLKQFYIENGHCNVPSKYVDKKLANFVMMIRRQKKQGNLLAYREKQLNQLGFIFDLQEESWRQKYKLLEEYYHKNGHCNVPYKYKDKKLVDFVRNIWELKKQGILPIKRENQLNKLEFIYDPHEANWHERYKLLEKYYHENEHCYVPSTYKDRKLTNFVTNIWRWKEEGTLSLQNEVQLSKIGFVFDPQEESWQKMYGLLEDYYHKHGHSNVPYKYKDKKLVAFVDSIRKWKRLNTISIQRENQLYQIRFIFDWHDASWQEKYQLLEEYYHENGHCHVPTSYKDEKLVYFIMNIKKWKREGTLSIKKEEQLNKIGFVFNMLEKKWHEGYELLKKYYYKNGHCNVPRTYKDRKLANFVANTRRCKKLGKLSIEMEDVLTQLGFIFNPLEINWQESYELLKEYYHENGHCNVPGSYKNRKLANFVTNIRKQKKSGALSIQREKQLNQLDFIFDVLEKNWQESYELLKEYYHNNGHCNVPRSYKDRKLVNFMLNIRKQKKLGALSTQKEVQLNKLNFVFSLK